MDDREAIAPERSPEEIRREIERTRSHMDETVDAIGDKLSPGRFVDELWARAQTEGAAAVTNTLREHPIPFALIGAGLGWLVMEQAKARSDGVGPGTYGRAEGRVGPYRGDAVDRHDPDWEHASAGTRMKAKVAGAGHAVKEKLSDAGSRLKETAAAAGHSVSEAGQSVRERAASATHAAGEKLTDAAHSLQERAAEAGDVVTERVSSAARVASERARQGAGKAKEGFWQLLDENPMALGAIAFGLGLASGMSAPATRWEDERMGRFAGPLKDEARRAVQDTAQKARAVAQDAVEAAKDELQHQRETSSDPIRAAVNQLKDSARAVGRAAERAARDRASSEELTAEGMKQLARQARDRVREPAGD